MLVKDHTTRYTYNIYLLHIVYILYIYICASNITFIYINKYNAINRRMNEKGIRYYIY